MGVCWLVIDFRRAVNNTSIENEAVVYLRPDDILEMCQDAMFMFLIDGRDFYFQRGLGEECRELRGVRSGGAWRPKVSKTSSAAAIVPISNELRGMIQREILMHCDDILGRASSERKSLACFGVVCSD
jgi:hypothetical protein